MAQELHTEIEIEAPTDVVWDILTDNAAYPEWNPLIVRSEGRPAVGERLINRLEPPDGRGMTFKPIVTELIDGQVFEWLGSPGVKGLFDGRHRFEVHPTSAGGTRLVHTERFSGVLVPVTMHFIRASTLAGFEAMNEALKARAEARVAAGDGDGGR